jgi:palmitoyltransferase ZDHHC2/15/20
MIVWSYLATVTTDPGRVPPGWHPFLDDQQARHELERMAYSDWPFDRYTPSHTHTQAHGGT